MHTVDTVERDVIALLGDLVAIDSVNPALSPDGAGERDIARYVLDWCRANGLTADLLDDGHGRPSVVARSPHRGPGTRCLLLCGHLDTVGFGSMADPLHARREGDRLYGRGAYDMKAGLAAALIAAREVARDDLGAQVVIAAVADEEHASLGIQRVLAGPDVKADAAIVNEPTEMAIGVAHKGFVWTEIEVHGVAAHGSRPELGVDAIAKAGAVLAGLDGLNRSLATRSHRLLGPGTVHASLIAGGQEASTIPEWCRLTIERRTLPGESLAQVQDEVRGLLGACAQADAQFTADAHTTMHRPALETPVDHQVVAALADAHRRVRGRDAEVAGMSYWADSAFIAAHGIPTVLFGPGGDGAHADVEWVSITDTVDCARVLIEVARGMGTGWGG